MKTLADTLAAAPHRLLFLAGALQTVAAMAWWLAILVDRLAGGGLPEPAIPPGAGHAALMLYGLLPLFVFGFLFTALPSWLETRALPRRHYLAAGIPMALGSTLFYPGLYFPPLAIAALLLLLAGWAIGLAALLALFKKPGLADTLHARAVWVAMALGWLGVAALAAWLAGAPAGALNLAMALGVWGFLTPLFLVVCHRMIPFFSSRVIANYVMIRPYGPLWFMLAACLGHGALALAGLPHWTWLADLPLAALALWFTARWGIARSFHVRLLAMVHIGFVWAALAFALHGVDSLAGWLGLGHGLGLAPLHALAIGFFGSMLVGMASRVSLGHSGRKLEADGFTWGLFWLVQVAAVVRMLPDLMDAPYALVAGSAALWLLAFVPWAIRYAPYYWRPRADGKPG
jgi:uncharacterized protein involved in response to NO